MPDHYFDGWDYGDDQGWDQGWDSDTLRWTTNGANCRPYPDQPGVMMYAVFGSAHPGGFNMVFCDGSVQSISYSIDMTTYHDLGTRDDGCPISASTY